LPVPPERTTIFLALAAAALGRRTTSVPFLVSAAIAAVSMPDELTTARHV
jgi:hypothetical protein